MLSPILYFLRDVWIWTQRAAAQQAGAFLDLDRVRIRIRIGSGFNSVFGYRSRNANDPQKMKKWRHLMFWSAGLCSFGRLEASLELKARHRGLKIKLSFCYKNVEVFSGLRIRILIGSGFNRVSGPGSVFGIRIRIQEGKNDLQKWEKSEILCFEVLDVIFWELKASLYLVCSLWRSMGMGIL